ncbi:MAG TPA: hypothetical protein VIW80_00750 [Pyrinomonadaceae bacterium]|jgi:hypothetical protein
MRIPRAILNTKIGFRLTMLVVVICTLGALTMLSGSPAAPATTSITIVNNSGWEIRHIYLSAADNDNWGPDQLNDGAINPGQTVTLSVSWDQPTVKIVSEDKDGCFLSNTADATGSVTWTITNDATPNCGG